MTGRQAILAHEAGHAVGALLAGHSIESVRLGGTRRNPDRAGTTLLDLEATPHFDFYGHLVAVLMGPMSEGQPPPPWPPIPSLDDDDSGADEDVAAHFVVHLKLSRADYVAAAAIAAHWLDDPFVKSAVAKLAHALGREGALTGERVRDVLGPGLLGWLEMVEPPPQGELCST